MGVIVCHSPHRRSSISSMCPELYSPRLMTIFVLLFCQLLRVWNSCEGTEGVQVRTFGGASLHCLTNDRNDIRSGVSVSFILMAFRMCCVSPVPQMPTYHGAVEAVWRQLVVDFSSQLLGRAEANPTPAKIRLAVDYIQRHYISSLYYIAYPICALLVF